MEFVTQEMMREANTMASKVLGLPAIESVLVVKVEIDRIRQQGSNVL